MVTRSNNRNGGNSQIFVLTILKTAMILKMGAKMSAFEDRMMSWICRADDRVFVHLKISDCTVASVCELTSSHRNNVLAQKMMPVDVMRQSLNENDRKTGPKKK